MMAEADSSEAIAVAQIRAGSPAAWQDLIDRFEGRLLAFVESRIGSRGAAEDVVQEAFLGFLTSLPHYDGDRPLESYLFSIAAHKLTDHLRRSGRRPTVPLVRGDSATPLPDPPDPRRGPSTLARSAERRDDESAALAAALATLVARWREKGDWEKLACLELLIVRGRSNKDTAELLGISEQTVANYKSDFLARLRSTLKQQGYAHDVPL